MQSPCSRCPDSESRSTRWTAAISGRLHVPPPVSVGDVLALGFGPPLKIVSVFHEDEEPVAISVRPLYVTIGNSPEI